MAAYELARTAMRTLDDLRTRRDYLARLQVAARGSDLLERGTRYCTVTNTAAAERAAQALTTTPGPLGVWGNLLAANGVTGLAWRSVEDHAAYIASLPVTQDRWETETRSGFGGRVKVEV